MNFVSSIVIYLAANSWLGIVYDLKIVPSENNFSISINSTYLN
jgi:hypothetical protein